jgi:hypothetical protein
MARTHHKNAKSRVQKNTRGTFLLREILQDLFDVAQFIDQYALRRGLLKGLRPK